MPVRIKVLGWSTGVGSEPEVKVGWPRWAATWPGGLQGIWTWRGRNKTSDQARSLLAKIKTTRQQSSNLEDQQVQQDVEGARGRGRRAGRSLPLCHDEGEVPHLLLAGINELHPAAVDQLVVMHLPCMGK